MSNAFERAVKRGDDTLFQDITLRNQSAQTDNNGDPKRDSYGNIEWATASETDVAGEIVYRGTPQFERRADGIDADVDVVVWVADDSVTFTDGADDEQTRATRVKADGKTYRLMDTFDERNGRRRGHGALEE